MQKPLLLQALQGKNGSLNLDCQRSRLCLLGLSIHALLAKFSSTPVTSMLSKEFIIIVVLIKSIKKECQMGVP